MAKSYKFLLFALAFLLLPIISAYNVEITINSNVADFNTDVYKCADSGCSTITFYDSVNSGTNKNVYSLIGSGDNYYTEYDYKTCMAPHIYRNHVWDPYSGKESFSITLAKKPECQGIINQGSLSKTNINLGESVLVSSNVDSAFHYPSGVPTTTAIPLDIHDEYSSKTKVMLYANGIKVDEKEAEILLASDKDFEFEFTPSSAGTYEIVVKSEVVDCACSSQNTQEFLIGTLIVNEPPKCTKNSDCGTNGFIGSVFCSSDDVFQDFITFKCNNPGTVESYCSDSTSAKLKQECGEDYCESWQNYCKDNDVYKKRTCYEKGCLTDSCYSNLFIEDEFVEECSYQCLNGECIDRCQENEDCGLPTEELVCLDGDVYNKITTPTCTQGNCENVITYELVEECAKECDNGMCIECCEDKECGTDGFIGEKYCQGKAVYQDYQEFSCINYQCESSVTPVLIEECSYMCVNGTCVEEECCTDEDCPEDSYGEKYCKNNNVYREFYNYFCENSKCSVNITEEIFENCGEDSCGSWQNYCKGDNVYKKRTCYDGGCRNGECYSNSSIEDGFVKKCDYDCRSGKCVEEEEEKAYEGGGKKLEVDYCGDSICDKWMGESEYNCEEDCKVKTASSSFSESYLEETESGIIGLGGSSTENDGNQTNTNFLIPAILIVVIVIIIIIIILLI